MALGPIPSAAIDRWIDRNAYDESDGADFRRCIRKMDAAFLDDSKEPLSEDGMSAMLAGLSPRTDQ